MSGTTSLPDSMIEILVEMHGETNTATGRRWTLRELAAWASTELGHDVSHMVVQRAIRPILDERAAMIRDALRVKIGEKIAGQIDTLDDLMTKVANDASVAKPMGRRKGLDVFRKALDSKLRASGVGDGKVTLSGEADGLAAFLGAAFGTAGPTTS